MWVCNTDFESVSPTTWLWGIGVFAFYKGEACVWGHMCQYWCPLCERAPRRQTGNMSKDPDTMHTTGIWGKSHFCWMKDGKLMALTLSKMSGAGLSWSILVQVLCTETCIISARNVASCYIYYLNLNKHKTSVKNGQCLTACHFMLHIHSSFERLWVSSHVCFTGWFYTYPSTP